MYKDYIVRQEDEKDCGAACLSSIIKYYKGYVPYEIVKYDTMISNNGTNFYNLKIAASKYGFNSEGIKNKEVGIPYIAQIYKDGFYHFIVIYKKDNNKIICMDPSIGIKTYTPEEYNKIFTGNILKLSLTGEIVKYKKKNILLEIIKNNKNIYIKDLTKIFILTISLIIINLISTYLLNKIIIINKYITLFIILSILKIIITYIKNIYTIKLNKTINYNLINNYLNKYFNLPFKYLHLKSPGDITNRIKDLKTIKSYISSEIINLLINIIFLIIGIIILFIINNKITIIITLLTILILYIVNKINNYLIKEYNYTLYNENIYMDKVCEYIDKIRTINYLNKNKYFINKLKQCSQNQTNDNYKIDRLNNYINIITEIYNIISLIIILYYSNNLETLLLYFLYYDYLKESINYFIYIKPNISYLKLMINRILGVYYLENKENPNKIKYKRGDIIVNNLEYSYGCNKIINKLSFKINKGDKVLIKGNNGTGKTTLLNILTKYIDNYKGNISINNIDIKEIDQISYSNNISYINQNSHLFNDTIINNIILDEKYNESKLNNIIKIVNLNKYINNNYNKILKNNYSGGEKQKLILARNLYKKFDILILDEAFSEISKQDRIDIINKINNYYKDKTIIYVNHFDDNIKYDKVIYLTKDARKEIKDE